MDLLGTLRKITEAGRGALPASRRRLIRTTGELVRTRRKLGRARRRLKRARRELDRTARDWAYLGVPRHAVCGAIGVDGALGEEILSATDPKHLHLMGPYRNGYDDGPGGHGKASARLAAEIGGGRVEAHRGFAAEISDDFGASYFDWIHVDSDRPPKAVGQDLRLYYPKVKPGGRVIGTGYAAAGRRGQATKETVDGFVVETRGAKLRVRGTCFVIEKGADGPAAWRIPKADRELAKLARRPGGPPRGRLPDFLLLGAQKCGTSFLFGLLNGHPDVEPAVLKEISYFSNFPEKGTDWYRSCFPAPARGEGGRPIRTWEASPNYLFYPDAPRRAAETAPDAKLIMLLRNPVDRAYSHYNHQASGVHEPLPTFEEALDAEEERMRPAREGAPGEEHLSVNFPRFSYASRGMYADQIMRWRAHFPENQILVVGSEDLYADPRRTLAGVLGFLGLPAWEPGPVRRPRKKRAAAPMNPATRERLDAFFSPHNRRLYSLLGRDFGWS